VILDTATIDRDVALTADVCVVGSGAGGSVVAKELAEKGRSVVVVEQGGYHTSRDFTQREEEMYPRLYQDEGVRAATDSTVLISQGRTVGGSTVTSFCICARPPRQILDHWASALGIAGAGSDDMAEHYERVERMLRVRELTPDQVNKNNRVVQAGAEKLGFRTVRLAHNRIECLGCGFCALGCSYDRKTDALATYLRAASKNGATIVPDCRVEMITATNGRASGLQGSFLRTAGKPATLRVKAKVIVLAAGAIASPQIWLRSRLPDPNRQVGHNLHLHPQVWLVGVFGEEIAGWHGIPQSIVVDEFLSFDDSSDGGFLLAPTFAHPIALASLLPGFGSDYRRLVELYPRLSAAAVVLHDRSTGSVEVDGSGRATVTYQLNDEDRSALADGMRRLADVYFAAGAERVILPFDEMAELGHRADYHAIDEHPIRANEPMLLSYHPQGSMRMGSNARRSVVNHVGEAHDVSGLFVADASIFPTAVAVPPQLSVMAFASRTAQHIQENAGRYFG
jgi:choline dehydrogenase-like flavoprotein